MDKIKLNTPLDEADICGLRASQQVLLSGTVYTARDMAHKRLCEALEQGDKLPFDLTGSVIYYLGPSPAPPGKVIGSAGPTTSSRMDTFAPRLFEAGVKATIGKGYRSSEVTQSLKDNKAVHLAATGGAGALLAQKITSSKIIAYEYLQTEAVRQLNVVDLPLVVAYDAYGGSAYSKND
jgi:fumarate hydratase subunit beta